MAGRNYIHGYSTDEQHRLIRQAEFWRERLIVKDLQFSGGQHVLDIGCGVGAVLAVLSKAFPGIRVSGIDIDQRQVDFGRAYLRQLNIEADLRTGDANELPWQNESFDYVYMMWFIEHLRDHRQVLQEAFRVLKPGGSIVVHEVDYASFCVTPEPENEDFQYCKQALYDAFKMNGNPITGRQLGPMLNEAGFIDVGNRQMGFHYFQDPKNELLQGLADYIIEFTAPAVSQMAELLGRDPAKILRGLNHLKYISRHKMGALSISVYRGTGRKY